MVTVGLLASGRGMGGSVGSPYHRAEPSAGDRADDRPPPRAEEIPATRSAGVRSGNPPVTPRTCVIF
ncbi:hypothetical protein GCM10023199_55710 [Actinomycetospora chibensis]